MFASTNPHISLLGDTLLGEFGPISLRPGQGLRVAHDLVIPADVRSGAYHIGFVVDTTSHVPDPTPANNIAWRAGTVTIREPAPDFIVDDLRLPSLGAANEPLRVPRNIGTSGRSPRPSNTPSSCRPTIDIDADVIVASFDRSRSRRRGRRKRCAFRLL